MAGWALMKLKMCCMGYNALEFNSLHLWNLVNVNLFCGKSHLYKAFNSLWPGPWFNIKMTSYQHRKSHCGDKMILRPSYLHNWIPYTGKTTSLYWNRALVPTYIRVSTGSGNGLLTYHQRCSPKSNLTRSALELNPWPIFRHLTLALMPSLPGANGLRLH